MLQARINPRHVLKVFLVCLPFSGLGGYMIGRQMAEAKANSPIRPWPHGQIRVYDASGWRPSVIQAMRQWNRAGVGVHFTLVDKNWDVVIKTDSKRCGRNCLGNASYVGYRGQQERIFLHYTPEPEQRVHMEEYHTRVIVHELGHIIGLPHAAGCRVMSERFSHDCNIRDDHFSPVCGPLRADRIAASRLYAGKYNTALASDTSGCVGKVLQ